MSSDLETITEKLRDNSKDLNPEEFWSKYISNIFGHIGSNTLFIYDFLNLDADAFIVFSYQQLLGRAPHTEEILEGLKFNTNTNEGKIDFLNFILSTREFASWNQTYNFIGFFETFPHNCILLRLKNNFLFSIAAQFVLRGWLKFKLLTFTNSSGFSSMERIEYLFFLSYNCEKASSQWLNNVRTVIIKICRLLLFILNYTFPFLFKSQSQFQISQNQELTLYYSKKLKDLRQELISATSFQNMPKPQQQASQSQKLVRKRDSTSSYFEFEKLFRGSEEMVKERLKFYIPHLKLFYETPGLPLALDVGFGRCEWMSLLRDESIPCMGIDIDPDLVKRAQSKGFDAVAGSASEWLSTKDPNSFGLITAFHVVEHLSFETLIEFLTSAYDSLAPGGGIIIETPNPENLLVGSFEFWIDPTHVRPYPSQTLEFWIKSIGFKNTQVIKLNPYNIFPIEGLSQEGLKNLIFRVNLERDYAIIARK